MEVEACRVGIRLNLGKYLGTHMQPDTELLKSHLILFVGALFDF